MRPVCLALVALLLVATPAMAQPAWVLAYREGLDAFERRNDALAEQKLLEAKKRGPDQSRRANFGGLNFAPFIPDYYLGLIAARNGRHAEGIRLLESAIANRLVTKREEDEYRLATAAIAKAKEDASRVAANPTPPKPTPPESTPPPKTTPTPTATPPATPPPSPPVWLAKFQKALDGGRSALRAGRFAEARAAATTAREAAGDAASRQLADQLTKDTNAAQDQEEERIAGRARDALRARNTGAAQSQIAALTDLDPQHPALEGLRREVERLQGQARQVEEIARVEREGARQFFSGNYRGAAATLQQSVGAGRTSPRIYLYLACSNAALALLSGPARDTALLEQARQQYSLARVEQNGFAADRRFISPRILELLSGNP